MNKNRFWENKRVLITGHTGFKGSWLTLMLLQYGAKICGISTNRESNNTIFDSNKKKFINEIEHVKADIRDRATLEARVKHYQPDIVFHLAAQPLVLNGYAESLLTWEVNLMGTLNLMKSLEQLEHKCIAIIVTTDKVYENNEINYHYQETDRLGGKDPYSASKASADIACRSWQHLLNNKKLCNRSNNIFLATARAGNVIGGGDWCENRIFPDCIRAIHKNIPLVVRNPLSTRPWQHVLDCLNGYIRLAEYRYTKNDCQFETYNFGPKSNANKSVLTLVKEINQHYPSLSYSVQKSSTCLESNLLQLDSHKAFRILGWAPSLGFKESVKLTCDWYINEFNSISTFEYSMLQVTNFINTQKL